MYDIHFSYFTYGRQSIPVVNREQSGNRRPTVALTFIYHASSAGWDEFSYGSALPQYGCAPSCQHFQNKSAACEVRCKGKQHICPATPGLGSKEKEC